MTTRRLPTPSRGRCAWRSQSGVTLIETLLVVTISSLVVIPLLGWGLTSMKEQANVRDRNTDSASVGLLRTYFIRDVASADDAKVGSAANGTDCTGGAGEASDPTHTVLRLGTGATTYTVYNVTADSEGTGTAIWRRECDGASLITSSEIVVRVDPGATAVTCSARAGAPVSDCGRIHLGTATTDGDAVTMTATVRTGEAISAPAGPVYESPLVNIVVTNPDPLYRGQTVTFDASASSDPQGQVLAHFWDFGDGTTSTSAVDTHAYSALGEFTAIYTATNEDGTPASDYKRLEVENRLPQAVMPSPANGLSTYRCTNVSFSAVGSNDSGDAPYGGSVVAYDWDYGDGTASTRTSPSAHNHQFARLSPGDGANPLTVSLTVEDNDGGESPAVTRSVTVANRAPNTPAITANGSGSDIVSNGAVTVNFASNASDPDLCASSDETLEYLWDFGDGQTSTSASPSHTFTSGGTHDVTLTVTDGTGASKTSNEISVSINDLPVAAFTLSSATVRAGTNQVSPSWITNNSYDPEGGALTYNWTFQNATSPSGGTSTAQTPTPVNFTHNVGSGPDFVGATYQVTLVVTDPLGGQATTSRTVTVTGAPYPGNFRKTGGGCASSSWGICNERYINFAWNSVSNADAYQINLDCQDWLCSENVTDTISGGGTTSYHFDDLGGTFSRDYRARIRTRDSVTGKWGGWSGWINVSSS